MKDKDLKNNFTKVCGLAYTFEDIQRIIDFCKKHSYFYYYIQHEKDDEVNKEHYHFIIESNSQHRFNIKFLLTDTFKINLFEKCESVNAYLRYMTHIDFDNKKHYDIENIITNASVKDLSKKVDLGNLTQSEINYINFCKIVDRILDGYIVSFKQVIYYCRGNDIKYSTNWTNTLMQLLRSVNWKEDK